MLLSGILLLGTLCTSVAGQARKIEAALNHTLLEGLNLFSRIQSFDGNPSTGALDALNIQAAGYHVQKAIEHATAVTEATPKFSDEDSLAIGTAVLGLLPPIKLLLSTIVDKKPAFQKVVIGLFDITGQIEKTLQSTKTLALALGNAIASKLTGGLKEAAPAVIEDLTIAFDKAIAAFAVE